MQLQRCQFGEANRGADFRIDTSGVCGPGIYAMLYGDNRLKKYYSARGEHTYAFEVPDKYVKRIIVRGSAQYQSIKEAILREMGKGFKVFICKYKGINIPPSKQVVITDHTIIYNIQKI